MSGLAPPALVYAPYIRDAESALRAPWHVAERRLLDYLLVYVQSGDCCFTVEGIVHTLGPGHFCLVQPGQTVDLEGKTPTHTPYVHFDLFFNPQRELSFATRPGQLDLAAHQALLQPRLAELAPHLPTVFREPVIGLWSSRLQRIIERWGLEAPLSRREAEAGIGALVMEVARHFEPGGPVRHTSPRLDWVPSYFSTHLSSAVRIEDLARRSHLSCSRFQVLFRQNYGTSPGKYLQEMRLSHACELLRGTTWTLSHIGGLCGYADVHHFAKAFKASLGVTPGQYRADGGMGAARPKN